MDVHVRGAVIRGLRRRGVDVLTAQEDGMATASDSDLLDRATALGRVLFTQDDDFLIEAARRRRAGEAFAGVVYAHQQGISTGACVKDLELIAKAEDPNNLVDRVTYLPL